MLLVSSRSSLDRHSSSTSQQLLRRTCAQLGATFVGTGRELEDLDRSVAEYNDIFGKMVNDISAFEHDESQGTALMHAREKEVLMRGMLETVGHVNLAFKGGGPDLTDLREIFRVGLREAQDEIQDALANLPAPTVVPAPLTPPGGAPGGSSGSSSRSGSPVHSVPHAAAFDAVFMGMVDDIKDAEFEEADRAVRSAEEQVIILGGLEKTLTYLEAELGGSRHSMSDLRSVLEELRVEEEAKADRLRAAGAGGGAVDTNAVERARLEQAFAVAKRAYDLAVQERDEALRNHISGDTYTPYRQAVTSTKTIKNKAEKDLAAFNRSHPPP